MNWHLLTRFVRNLLGANSTRPYPARECARQRLAIDRLEDRAVPACNPVPGDFVLEADDTFDVSVSRQDTNPCERVRVRGSVTINDAALNVVELDEQSRSGQRFILIENDGQDPVAGQFAGLPEGAVIVMPDRAKLQISYQGGPGGNDVVLTRINSSPTFINRTLTSLLDEGGRASLTGTIVDPDPWDIFLLDVDWGDGVRETFRYGPRDSRDLIVTHAYADDAAAYTVRFSWSDQTDFGNAADLTTVVRNVDPVITPLSDVRLGVGDSLRRVVTFSDPGADRWTAQVDYGDGSRVETLSPDRFNRFLLSHVYDKPGVYEVSVTITDDDGGSDRITFRVAVE